jgi:hypothetical protein
MRTEWWSGNLFADARMDATNRAVLSGLSRFLQRFLTAWLKPCPFKAVWGKAFRDQDPDERDQ